MNINAAPLDHEGYRTVKDAGIGTYQIFQETYHHETYAAHAPGRHAEGRLPLAARRRSSRAMEAGCDDVGIGALFGLYDWRFEVLGLVSHALHLQERYGVGPHTISFPRLRPACGVDIDEDQLVSDDDFKRLVAILRLAVPYTGLILTARETAELRREVMAFGVSQIDAGSRIEIGGYTEAGDAQVMEREQFSSATSAARRGHARAARGRLRAELLHGLLPPGPHRRALHGVRDPRLHPAVLHAQRPDDADGVPRPTTPRPRRGPRAEVIAAEMSSSADEMAEELAERLERIRTTDERDLYF